MSDGRSQPHDFTNKPWRQEFSAKSQNTTIQAFPFSVFQQNPHCFDRAIARPYI